MNQSQHFKLKKKIYEVSTKNKETCVMSLLLYNKAYIV